MKTDEKNHYFCINCGNSLKFIFKEYSPNVLKLIECDVCHQIGDKYIEYDPVIVFIDLILLNKEAYRHILFNSPFKNNWKLALILLLIDSYAEWSILKNSEEFIINHHYDIFKGERIFYFILFRSIVCISFFFFTILFLTWTQTTKNIKTYHTYLWKAFLISSFGKFLRLSEIIWGDINSNINSTFIIGYSFLSQLQSYSEKPESWIWNENENCLVLWSSEKLIHSTNPKASMQAITPLLKDTNKTAGCSHGHLLIKFRDFLPLKEQLIFKKYVQRKIKLNDNPNITMRDIKDIVIFQCISDIPNDSLDLFYTRHTDRLLRSLLFYFQKYIEILEFLNERAIKAKYQLRYSGTLRTEEKLRVSLRCHRAMIGREYCNILQSLSYPNGQHLGQLERDVRLFEILYALSARFIYITLNRRYANLIEIELNRLFRSNVFNLTIRRKGFKDLEPIEKTVLQDFPVNERRTFAHSPIFSEMTTANMGNYRLLGIGRVPWTKSSIETLELGYLIPEELLRKNGFELGILGLPRDDFDIMLMPKLKEEEEEEQKSEKFIPTKLNEELVTSTISKEEIETEREMSDIYMSEQLKEEEFDYVSSSIDERQISFPTSIGFFDIQDFELDFENIQSRKAWHYFFLNKKQIQE